MPSISIDGPNKLIDIGYDAGTTIVTAPDIYSEWKRWVQLGNAQYFEAFSESVGGNDLGGGAALDGYYFLRNDLGWRIRAADIDHELVIDGQLFGFAAGTALFLARPSRTITYRQLVSSRSQVVDPAETEIGASAAYNGRVVLDPTSAFSDTNYPTGTNTRPVNNWPAAVAIANTYNLREIDMLGALTLTGVDVTNFSIHSTVPGIVLVIDPSATVLNCTFEDFVITGTCDGFANFNRCGISLLDGVFGNFVDCVLAPGGLTLAGDSVFLGCASGVPGNGSPDVYYDGGAHEVQFRAYAGSVHLHEMAAGATTSVDLISGRVIVNADNTGGELKVRGVGEPVVDNSAGAVNIDDDGMVIGGDLIILVNEGIEQSSYMGRVHIDTVNGTAGTAHPIGTHGSPVDNLADALTICSNRGFESLHFMSDYTFTNGDDISFFEVSANGPSLVTLTFPAGVVTAGTQFKDVKITGQLIAPASFDGCVIEDITGNTAGPTGRIILRGSIFEGTITLSSSLSGEIEIRDCSSDDSNAPIFDVNGAAVDVYFSGYNGDFTVRNCTTPGGIVRISAHGGVATLEASNTEGSFRCYGIGTVVNNTTGNATVLDKTIVESRFTNTLIGHTWAASG